MSASRFDLVTAILAEAYPYRIRAREVRRMLAVFPLCRRKHRRAQARLIAAMIVLPYRLDG